MSLYKFGRFIVSAFLRTVFRLKIEGKENVSPDENYLVCSNHISNLDPPMLGVCMPFQLRYMAKEELFRNKLFGALIRTLGAFPVHRGSGDVGAVKTALTVLKNGESLVMFPEGGRSDGVTLRRGKSGAALVAFKSGVRILPVGISGAYKPFRKMTVRIGKPISLAAIGDESGRKEINEKLQALTDGSIMPEIASLSEMKMYER